MLVAFPSGDDRAKAVAEAIAAGLADCSLAADVVDDDCVTSLSHYAALVLGTPRGRDSELHPPKLVWIEPQLQQALPVAVFGVEPRPLDEQGRAASRAHLEHALTHMPWLYPLAVEVFSAAPRDEQPAPGRSTPALGLLDREAIRAWAHTLPGLLGLPVPVG